MTNEQASAFAEWLEDTTEATAEVLTRGSVRLTPRGEEDLTRSLALGRQILGRLHEHAGVVRSRPAIEHHRESERRAAVVQAATDRLRTRGQESRGRP